MDEGFFEGHRRQASLEEGANKPVKELDRQEKDDYMQNYLNEFCYKCNRRYFGEKLFDRLIVANLKNQ